MDDDQLIQDKQELVDRSVKEYFYKTNYVKDNITKIYPEDVTITKEALDKLNAGVIAKLRNHQIEGLIINIDVVFENNVHVHFGRWEDYKKYDWDNANSISSIILEWKFNVYVHETEFPQEQVLTVKMSNEIKPTELFSLVLSGNLSDVSDLESKFSPIVAQVTFTDRTFANELILLVTQWSEHVKNSKWTSKFALFLKKHKVKISKTVDFLTVFLIIFGSSGALLNHLNVILPEFLVETSKETFLESTKWVIALLIVFKFSVRIGHWFGNSLFNLIRDYGNSYVFNITKNDEEKITKMQKQNRYDIIKGVGLVISNILINLFFIFLDRII